MQLPKARTADILEQVAGDELMIYDLRIDKAYNLNETSKAVYKACGQQMSFDELKRRHKFTDDLIYFALDELQRENLIEGEYQSQFAGMSRREAIRKVGLASMIALPMIVSLVAPTSLHAASFICTCPSTEPVGCISGTSYSLGCFPNNSACSTAGAASGGTHCCNGIAAVVFNTGNSCCFVGCRSAPR